jgi:hypothetical protein
MLYGDAPAQSKQNKMCYEQKAICGTLQFDIGVDKP